MTQTIVDETRPEVALADLGVRPELITADERRCLDTDGYVVLENVIPEEQLVYIRECIDNMLHAQRPENASDADLRRRAARRLKQIEGLLEAYDSNRDAFLEHMSEDLVQKNFEKFQRRREALRAVVSSDDVGAIRAMFEEARQEFDSEAIDDDLFESDPVFDLTMSSPRVLSGVAYVMGPMFQILNLVSRCPRPGEGQQALHRTAFGPRRIATTIWLIDDMTLDNGPTRLVPGSHLTSEGLPKVMNDDPTQTHPDEIKLTGKAGSVVVFDDRCWHGGSLHNGGGPRRVVISSFTLRSKGSAMAVNHPDVTLPRLSPGQRWLLHV